MDIADMIHAANAGYIAALPKSQTNGATNFVELVQDRANELITHWDNEKTVLRIAHELDDLTTALIASAKAQPDSIGG